MARFAVVFKNNIRTISQISLNNQPLNARLVASLTNKNPLAHYVSYIDAPLNENELIIMKANMQINFQQVFGKILFYNLDVLEALGESVQFERIVAEAAIGLRPTIDHLAVSTISVGITNFVIQSDNTWNGVAHYLVTPNQYNSQQPITKDSINWTDLKNDILDEIDLVRTSECVPFFEKDGIMDQYNQIIEDFERNDINILQAKTRFESLVAQHGDKTRCIGQEPNTCFTARFEDGTEMDFIVRDSDYETVLASLNDIAGEFKPDIINVSDCGGQPENVTSVQDKIKKKADELRNGTGGGDDAGTGLGILAVLAAGAIAALALRKRRK